jgi:predicted deacetylase
VSRNKLQTASQTTLRALCVSIHDVAPSTWAECMHLLRAVREVADIPLTWLVVPHYHDSALRSRSYELMLGALLAQGHELVLHGYTHRDEAPLRGRLPRRLLRTVYTEREGEFADIDGADARRRIDLGLAWFRQRGWPVDGFVAPAWLLGEQAWAAVAEYPFTYTTTYAHFHVLRPARKLLAPALVYAARNRAGRALSPPLMRLGARLQRQAPLVRLALHPRDAYHPALVQHAQRLIERLLAAREPVTKGAFARAYAGLATSKGPSARPGPSGLVHSQPNSWDDSSAPCPPWRSAAERSRAIDPS